MTYRDSTHTYKQVPPYLWISIHVVVDVDMNNWCPELMLVVLKTQTYIYLLELHNTGSLPYFGASPLPHTSSNLSSSLVTKGM